MIWRESAMSKKDKEYIEKWVIAALVRAGKTFAQAAVAAIGVSATMGEVNWITVTSTAALSAVLSVLTSIAGLPEVDTIGKRD